MSEQNINLLQSGMVFTNPSTVKDGQYLLLVNGVIQTVNGNFLFATNEPSNLLATKFKEGCKVIGTSVVPSLSVTFFFLHNPQLNKSEIGFIYDTSSPDKPDLYSQIDNKIIEDTPLELTVQNPLSEYYTFVNADCLNFDVDHPVVAWVKIDDCNIRIYFNDFKNPPRYIDYTNFPKVTLSNCPLIETDQLDCDKILVFPETCYPIVEVVDIVSGGQNLAGVYQFAIAYSDVNSNKITDYFYVTNPIPLYDQPITIATNYPVAKSFKLRITNLNTDFRYFNLVVIKTINNVTTPQLVETFDLVSNNFEYIYTGNDKNVQQNLTISEILSKRPYYNKAKGLTESNGYLFHFILEEDRILNLQPVVNNITPLWQTVELDEGAYANPIIAQNYVSFLGDEVYPLGIAFTKNNGKSTNIFPFVGRESTSFDLENLCQPTPSGICQNPDVISSSTCSTDSPNSLRWQVYNTASVIDDSQCVIFDPTQTPTQIIDDIDCSSNQILINSVDVDPVTGNTTPKPIPNFWKYPPPIITYPPQNKDEVLDLYTDFLDLAPNVLNNIATDQTVQNEIDLCDCQSYEQQYIDAGATDITITTTPIIINPYVDDTSIEIVQEETVFPINNYSGVVLSPPKPSNYPYSPSPCKNSEYEEWFEQKVNVSSDAAELIVQNDGARCSDIQTWGSFLTEDDGTTLTSSWYQFYVTNTDGVAAILLSTSNVNGINDNFSEVKIYATDSNNNPILPPIISTTYIKNGDGIFILLENLETGKPYFIEVLGKIGDPASVSLSCKQRVFRLCVVSPPPSSTIYTLVPGIAIVTKTCNISYFGFPQDSCQPSPYEYGNFSYIESQETYPCNKEVWGDLAGKPIRHFKFPDNSISPFYREQGALINNLSVKSNKIYPKGFIVNIEEIKLALNQAVATGLITEKERNEICGYRLYRGNRRGNNSIVAKGLMYDIWEYKDNIYNTGNKILFPNFPFNDNTPNQFIKNKRIKNLSSLNDANFLRHPFNSERNNKYTFDAPNLSFNNPGLGTEIKLEAEQAGKSIGNFIELRNNSKYQYIGAGIISAAIGFASVEAAFEGLNTIVNATLSLPITVFGSGTAVPLGLILAIVGENIIAPVRVYSHYAEWYDIIKKFAPYRNYGTYYTGVGKYTENLQVPEGNIRRTIANTQYLKPGILNVKTLKGSTRFNNFKRESSVFIELEKDSFFLSTSKEDNSRQQFPSCDVSTGVTGNISSFYGSMKNYVPSQYGQIDNIEWIDTGYNGRIDWTNPDQTTLCDTVFGGDTYINRFTKKRKIPLFLEDRVVSSINQSLLNQDIQLSLLPNVGYPRFFMDYPTALDYTGITNALFGDVAVQSNTKVDFNFICKSSDGQAWKDTGLAAAILGSFAGVSFGIISLPIAVGIIVGKTRAELGNDLFLKGKYVHSFYGITSFLCESDYNLDLRHGTNLKEGDFYPNVGDTNEWTQESFVPIAKDNTFNYNNDYSKQNKENPNFVLNNDFSQIEADCKIYHPNRLIYSLQDTDQNSDFDGNLIYLANNYQEFPKSGGLLQIVKSVDTGVVLVIQENQASAFNSFISLQTNANTDAVGSNSLFNKSLPTQYIKTDLGFGGSQTPAIITTEYGSFWVDNKRGQILKYQQGITNIVKPEEQWWFNENLPFHILADFPEFDITNNFKYIGMAITYDAKFKRIIFTKRDVEVKPLYKKLITYDGTLFHFDNETFTIENDKYFCNKSWTISYSPLTNSFTSFHTYYPNYYVQNQQYFSYGVNYPINSLQEGSTLWHNNLTSKSYQVFEGAIHSFIFEYAIPSKYQNTQLESLKYSSQFYRFQDNNSAGLIPNLTFNKCLIYNFKQTSGLLELVPKEKNNRQQFIQYPKQNSNSRTILTEQVEREWHINSFYDIATENSGQPLLQYDCNNVAYTELNPLSISYKPQYLKKKLVADYHVIRLINDKYSNYNIQTRQIITQTNNINS